MKKLILFISLTFAFGASFAGVKAPLVTSSNLAFSCIANNKLNLIKLQSSLSGIKYFSIGDSIYANGVQSFNNLKLSLYLELFECNTSESNSSNYLIKKNIKNNTNCAQINFLNDSVFFKEVKKTSNYFKYIFEENLINKYYSIHIDTDKMTCGDTGKKIKPVTITKIKRFHPIILEVQD